MGGACSTHGSDEKFRSENLKGNHSEDLSVDGNIILEWILGRMGEMENSGQKTGSVDHSESELTHTICRWVRLFLLGNRPEDQSACFYPMMPTSGSVAVCI
jgi:hypothetical protein